MERPATRSTKRAGDPHDDGGQLRQPEPLKRKTRSNPNEMKMNLTTANGFRFS